MAFSQLRKRAVQATLIVGAFLAVANLGIDQALAESGQFPAFDQTEDMFAPGRWQPMHQGRDPSKLNFLAVMKVEEETGARFCKVKFKGQWWTNLIDCRSSVRGRLENNVAIDEEGVMDELRFEGLSHITYMLTASEHDRKFTDPLRKAQRFVLAGRHLVRQKAAEASGSAPDTAAAAPAHKRAVAPKAAPKAAAAAPKAAAPVVPAERVVTTESGAKLKLRGF